MPDRFLLVNTREPQSMNVKLVLPIIPIGIVAYAFALLWDNLCRNSGIYDHPPYVCLIPMDILTVYDLSKGPYTDHFMQYKA